MFSFQPPDLQQNLGIDWINMRNEKNLETQKLASGDEDEIKEYLNESITANQLQVRVWAAPLEFPKEMILKYCLIFLMKCLSMISTTKFKRLTKQMTF